MTLIQVYILTNLSSSCVRTLIQVYILTNLSSSCVMTLIQYRGYYSGHLISCLINFHVIYYFVSIEDPTKIHSKNKFCGYRDFHKSLIKGLFCRNQERSSIL